MNSNEIERQRQSAITHYELGSDAEQEAFSRITRLIAELFDMPVAIISILTEDRQLFLGPIGIDPQGTRREDAFCNVTVRGDEVLVIENATVDDRFSTNNLVCGDPNIRFYAGAPLQLDDGPAIGSLCLIDHRPRTFSDVDRATLQQFAVLVTDTIRLRLGAIKAQRRQDQLKRQTDILNATVANITEGVAVFDEELKLVTWNDLFFSLLGFDDALKVEGKRATDLLQVAAARGDFGEGDADEIVQGLIASIRATSSRKLEMKTAGGRHLEVWRTAMPGGQLITVDDVTARHEMGRMKDEFVSTVSHELRTPLTSIRGAVALLNRELGAATSDRARAMLDMALSNSERLAKLVDDILDIEKLTSGASAFVVMHTELDELVRQSVRQLQPFTDKMGVNVQCVFSPRPAIVYADPGRVMQVLTNLISNAAKFSPSGATVSIAVSSVGDVAQIEVSDEGPGVAKDFVPRLFTRFAQAQSAVRADVSGTGLGLAISRAIVEQMGGEIGYRRRSNGGACFFFTLTLAEPAA